MALRKTPRENAVASVRNLDAQALTWAARRDGAIAELATLEERIGEVALSDPVSADGLPGQLQALRDRALVAGRALDAVSGKALAARRDAVRAEADEIGPGIEAARSALAGHDKATAGLLAALVDHAGEDYERVSERPVDPSFAVETRVVKVPARWALADALAALERAQVVLFAVADGRDPTDVVPGIGVSELPESVRPGGLLPAPGFELVVDPQVGLAAELAEVQSRLDAAQALVGELEANQRPGLEVARRSVKELSLERDNVAGYVTASVA